MDLGFGPRFSRVAADDLDDAAQKIVKAVRKGS